MKHFEVGDAHHAYPSLLQYVLQQGKPVPSRVGDTVEVEDLSVCFAEPRKTETPRRKNSAPLIGYMEGAQLVGALEANSLMRMAWPKYFEFSDGYGNYGARAGVSGQLEYAFQQLSTDPQTRRAIVTLWSPERDVPAQHMDHPCTVGIMFRVRDGALNMTVTMRSQDMWLGHPYDVIQFALLQQTFATALGLQCGTFTHHMASCHIYIRDVPAINFFLDSYDVGVVSDSGEYDSPAQILPLSEPGWDFSQIALEARRTLSPESEGVGAPETECGRSIAESVRARLVKMHSAEAAAVDRKSE